MDRHPDTWVTRRTLFQGPLFELGHVVCRPTPEVPTEVERAGLNVLALTTAGVWALHEGPRQHVIATPSHAVFISSGRSYRMSFPGCIGDECITMRLTADGLARLAPQVMARDGFDGSVVASRALLPPSAILARGVLMRTLSPALSQGRGSNTTLSPTLPQGGGRNPDPLLIEELAVGLLDSALNGSHESNPKSRHVERVKEAISTSPERRWTLAELSGIAGISPCHLAHVFRREVGTPVYRYAIRLRLATALNAVLDSNLDLTSIALDAGFASHSHFTARFRALFGLTPDALRRTARSGKAAELRKFVTARQAVAA